MFVLEKPILARYIRVVPFGSEALFGIRFGVYGSVSNATIEKGEIDCKLKIKSVRIGTRLQIKKSNQWELVLDVVKTD